MTNQKEVSSKVVSLTDASKIFSDTAAKYTQALNEKEEINRTLRSEIDQLYSFLSIEGLDTKFNKFSEQVEDVFPFKKALEAVSFDLEPETV